MKSLNIKEKNILTSSSKKDILNKLFSLQRFGIKPGLERTNKILSDYDNPQNTFPSIHVAGTNGKGFTCSAIASVLMEAGYKVGLYTSPHLVDFNERIIINGEMISDNEIIKLADEIIPYSGTINATFFEVTTVMAFIYFARQKVDIAVIETGLGGRFDSTNVLGPILSVITSIGIEHSEYLGNTLPDIAFEKAGIIKKNTPCVVFSENDIIYPVFHKKSIEMNTSLHFADKMNTINTHSYNSDFTLNLGISTDKWSIENTKLPFAGIHQIMNLKLALACLELISDKYNIQTKAIIDGLTLLKQNTNYKSRLEFIRKSPPLLVDTAHNPQAIEALIETLQLHGYDNTLWNILYSAMGDKDISSILGLLKKHCHTLYLTEPKTERSMKTEIIAQKAIELGYKKIIQVKDSKQAFSKANQENKPLIVCGSFFLVGELDPI